MFDEVKYCGCELYTMGVPLIPRIVKEYTHRLTVIGDHCVIGGNVWLTHSVRSGRVVLNERKYFPSCEISAGGTFLVFQNMNYFKA